MEKLDLKDRKIIYHLDLDSRQSFRSIGKKVGLNKDAVALRVKKLQERGIIKNFYLDAILLVFHPSFNPSRDGYSFFSNFFFLT